MTGELRPHSEFDVPLEDGATAAVRVFGSGPRLVMSHGNGFAIDAYRSFWAGFVPDHQVVVFDFRHHGRSSPYAGPIENWPQFVRDFERIITAIDAQLGRAPTAGVFHSMSALTAMLHASAHPTPWLALVAFEPPAPPPANLPEAAPFALLHEALAAGAERRRVQFDDPDELLQSFRRHRTFDRIGDAELRDLAYATLRPNEGGKGYVLACERDFEAETFRLRHLDDPWRRISSLTVPVTVVSSDPAVQSSAVLPPIAEALARAGGYTHQRVANSTHFLQLERPRECERIVRDAMSRLGSEMAAGYGTPGASAG